MTAADTHPTRSRPSIGLILVVAAPLTWLLHLLVSYALVPLSCRVGSDLPLHAVTVAAGAAAAVTTAAAFRLSARGRRRPWGTLLLDGSAPTEPGDTDDRRTVFVLAACLAAYFSVVVALTALVAIVVDRCA